MGSQFPPCADCGDPDARTSLSGTQVCDRCLNGRVSQRTGWSRLPDPPPDEVMRTADDREVRFCYRLTWAPSGVMSAEAEEADQPPGDGFRFGVYGEHDADPDAVLAQLRRVVHREVGRAYLEPHASGAEVGGTRWMIAGDDVAGRIDWSGDGSVREPSVVIDGRRFDWDEFGRMVASFEGWEFRMRLDDSSDGVGAGTGGEGEEHDGGEAGEVIALFGGRGSAGRDTTAVPSIDEVLAGFLAVQRERLAASTYARYDDIVDLLRHCLNGYGYQSLTGAEAQAWQEAFDAGDEEAFTRLCGPERIVEHYGEFLGYFMVRKVAASKQQLKDAGTVTKRLARWLAEEGVVETDAAEQARDRAADAGRELPRADELGHHLFLHSQRTRLPEDPDDIPDQDWVEDHLPITRIEDGRLWFDDIGPVEVPTAASDLAEVGWHVTVVLARLDGAWRLVQVGTVYP
ncbi:MAG: hypothetical protein WEB03_13285 [Nitriliruptor sp.]|uniref:DUF7713 domain-containing protein n=1 Tax=Nitriliruptor sp. TaxID=2448056 RepID=UPI0034A04F07